ncbi:MAG: putative zinc metalloprotease Rip2 [Chloroflexi bacterium]|nr:putative zinc metalloprotease Rip2 [Chloroflexota bacterium]
METLILIAVLLFSIVIHEVAHGAMAYYLGDPTAKYAGRLTLNPIRHLDPIGSILVPLFLVIIGSPLFGWAKPVPFNPYYLRDRRYGSLKVAIAGPASNLLIALVFGLLIRSFPDLAGFPAIFLSAIVFVNILLAVINLMPIPPLDGSHILFTFLPSSMQRLRVMFSRYGFVILVIFIVVGGFRLIFPLVLQIFSLITGL